MIRISNIKIPVNEEVNIDCIKKNVSKILKIKLEEIKNISISKKSIDARDKLNVVYVISVDVNVNKESKYLKYSNISKVPDFKYVIKKVSHNSRPLVVGFGPAGFMAGLILAKAGLNPLIIEQGKDADKRKEDVENFWKTGSIDFDSNVQFGEGGAGTFSDGKLTTGIKSELCNYILKQFVSFGAPEEILYLSKPHIGTDNLISMVKNIRKEIISLGAEVLFENKLHDIIIRNNKVIGAKIKNSSGIYEFKTDNIILAIGHSSRDTFNMLYKNGIHMESKPFSVGVRIEHNQEFINKIQYGEFSKYLPAADYKLSAHLPNGRSAYTFCMCPGGVVVNASSHKEGVVTNGMSYYKRDGKNSNSALLISVYPSDFESNHPLSGIKFQERLEHKAFIAGGRNYNAPFQTVGDLFMKKATLNYKDIVPTFMPNAVGSDFREIFPDYIYESILLGIIEMDKKIKGFADKNAILTAVETRSSSPVRILRNQNLYSALIGLIPCGEGGGYAGGIMSAAVDGIRCAQTVINNV